MSRKSTPTDIDEVIDRLNVSKVRVVHTLPDPDVETSISVTLDQIKPYDFNPRKQRNPLYDEIKEAVRLRGLDHKPNITRRPGEDLYMIADGGNTRLAILNELWADTQDEKFFRFNCVFKPWKGDVAAMVAHFSENNDRSGILFIEQALAARDLREKMEEEQGAEFGSLRKVATSFTEHGWKTDASVLGRYDYAVSTLLQHTPEVLWAGAGLRFVRKVRGATAKFAAYWSCIDAGKIHPSAVDEFYFETLAEYDDLLAEDIAATGAVLEQVNRTVNSRLAELAGISAPLFDVEVNHLADGLLTPETVTNSIHRPPQPVSEQSLPGGSIVEPSEAGASIPATTSGLLGGKTLSQVQRAAITEQARQMQRAREAEREIHKNETAKVDSASLAAPFQHQTQTLLQKAHHIADLADELACAADLPGTVLRISDSMVFEGAVEVTTEATMENGSYIQFYQMQQFMGDGTQPSPRPVLAVPIWWWLYAHHKQQAHWITVWSEETADHIYQSVVKNTPEYYHDADTAVPMVSSIAFASAFSLSPLPEARAIRRLMRQIQDEMIEVIALFAEGQS